jgi:hypothetical protein
MKLSHVLAPLAALSIMIAIVALAPSSAKAYTDKLNTTVLKVYATQDGLLINLASGHTGEGCTGTDWAIIRSGSSFPNWQQQFSIAHAAYLSGRTVRVRLSGCATTSAFTPGTYPVVFSLQSE